MCSCFVIHKPGGFGQRMAKETGGGGDCGRDESSFCASVKTAQGVPGVPLAMLKTCRFSEGFAGTSPFLHHFFFSHHVGISWQAKTLSYKMPDQL